MRRGDIETGDYLVTTNYQEAGNYNFLVIQIRKTDGQLPVKRIL